MFGRGDVESFASHGKGGFLNLPEARGDDGALRAQHVRVHLDAVAFGARQDFNKRHLDLPEKFAERFVFFHAWRQRPVQPQGNVGVFRGVAGGLFDVDLIKGQLMFSAAGDVGELDGLMPEMLARQGVHVVAGVAGVQQVGHQHGVVGYAPQGDAVMLQYFQVVFNVLAGLRPIRVLQYGPQFFKGINQGQLRRRTGVAMLQRQIRRLPRRRRE